MSLAQDTGETYSIDPRSLLSSIQKRLEAHGLIATVATEMEFYLFSKDNDAEGRPIHTQTGPKGKLAIGGQTYGIEKEWDEAEKWYKKAIEVHPRYSYAFNNLANIYKNEQNYEEAIKYYKQAVEHLSTYTLALANMGVCYLKIGNYREAFNAMERAK